MPLPSTSDMHIYWPKANYYPKPLNQHKLDCTSSKMIIVQAVIEDALRTMKLSLEFGPIIFCHLYICTRYNAIQKDREEIE
jgi:hypothetical protein